MAGQPVTSPFVYGAGYTAEMARAYVDPALLKRRASDDDGFWLGGVYDQEREFQAEKKRRVASE
jgi:hypothetical protein